MINELDNPFSVTKATEFSNDEINEYWVNFNTEKDVSIDTLLNPKEYMPKYIIGGKGCGKTHILRYFSFPLQKIRFNNNIENILKMDQYIGLYSIFHGLNSSRFSGKGITDDEWQSVFEYYFELYICDNLLHTIQEIFSLLKLDPSIENEFIIKSLSIFNNYKEIKGVASISDLIEFLAELRRKIDFQVLNAAFARKLDIEEVRILFAPGDLLFGIPSKITNSVEQFKGVKFIFIFDEFEKLFEWQKKFVNTLVWDKKTPVTFWIGARRFGYTTRETKSGQEMKSGSEFQDISLDIIIRKNEVLYKQFAEKLYTNRLIKYYENKGLRLKSQDVKNNFFFKFEPYNEDKVIEEIIIKNKKKEYKHLKKLRNNITEGIKSQQALNLVDERNIDNIIREIVLNTNDNPLEQKYKIFYLYKLWYKGKKDDTFGDFLKLVNKEYDKFKLKQKSKFDDIVDKRKKDFIAQLSKENNIKNNEFSGVDEFIKISQGNVRSFILLLKKSVEYAKIKGEKPLEDGGRISLDSQYFAVYDTARWFYEDADLVGENGKNMYGALKRLTDYFKLERFCDKPVETTVSCFYIKSEEISANAIACIETMKMHSVLIEDESGRIEKNSGRKERKFQINKVLAPLWNLPTVVRGSLSLNRDVVESIFNPDLSKNFIKFYNLRKGQLNAPDFVKKANYSDEMNNNLFTT